MATTELIWIFLCYSFLGWILETVYATIKHRKFANRGFINGPFCTIYGLTAVVVSLFLRELTGIWLFLFSMIYATVIEWIAGHLIEKLFKQRWWDYSEIKWNLDGYICAPMSVIWGLLGYIAVKWGNTLTLGLFHILPKFLGELIIYALLAILIVDIAASFILIRGKSRRLKQWESANQKIDSVRIRLEKWITKQVSARIDKAYPIAKETTVEAQEVKSDVFAYGCSFYKIVLLFIIGAFLGDIVETIFCKVKAGIWMSRSSVVWGPFSLVWGIAIALATLLLYKYKDKGEGFLFCMGTFLGGAYEYLCSVFTEIVFGQVFWDYSKIPFNLGGRINLLYCFFWGIAAVVWIQKLYPPISNLIEKISVKTGKIMTWCLIVFMTCNIIVSCMALGRYNERNKGIEAKETWQIWMDEHYNDEKMQKIYPNSVTVE